MSRPAPSPSSAASLSSSPPSDPADAQSCSLCLDPFATAADGPSISADRRPRVLGCGHSFCGSCLHEDMKRRRCCALCKAAIAHSDAGAVPVNFDLIASLLSAEGAAKQMAALRLQMEAARLQSLAVCAECDQPATLFCEQCGDDLCAAHSQHVHSLKKFQSHTVVAAAEKAALLAASQQRDAKARANKCALHPDQIKYLYCEQCKEAVCAVCVHAKHADCLPKPVEVSVAAAKVRAARSAQLQIFDGPADAHRPNNPAGLHTLADADMLSFSIDELQRELQSSSVQAQSDIDALAKELRTAVKRRQNQLTRQLQQQTEAASAALSALLSPTDRTAAEGAQMRAAIEAADAHDDYDTLANAPRIAQLCAAMRDQMRELVKEVAVAVGPGGGGVVGALRLEDGAKAATLSALAGLGFFTELRATIALGQGSAVITRLSDGPLWRLESCVLPSASEATLLQFFGNIPIPSKLLYRATRDGFKFDDWKKCCLGKGPTMTLVKAMASGFVFGTYTHCKWPRFSFFGPTKAADPSGQSFLFSLVNATGRPVRFSLRDKDAAVWLPLGGGVCFGWNGVNFLLNYDGAASDGDRGNTAWELDEERAYQPDDGDMDRGVNFFAGSENFAAADIEVYEL